MLGFEISRFRAVFQHPPRGIPDLFEMLRQLKTLGYRSCPERDEVINDIESALLAIPGHAQYYQDKIEGMREEVLANSKKSEAEIEKIRESEVEVADPWTYERFSVLALRTLAQLPSPETVAVLGFYLNDPVGRDGKTLLGDKRRNPGDDFDPRPIHSEQAVLAIRSLGIDHPPFLLDAAYSKLNRVQEGEVDAWKNWWNEIKEGRRTYRFIGSSIEYGPEGPANKVAIQRNDLNRKRDDERSGGIKKATSAPEPVNVKNPTTKPFFIGGIIAACLLVAGAILHLMRTKRRLNGTEFR